MVGNLLANAIKFTPEGGRIEAAPRARRAAAPASASRDTGSGISPEFLPFIFERFRQADTTSTRKQKGLGLGLAIARHIVEMHGGSIEAASAGRRRGQHVHGHASAAPLRDDEAAAPAGQRTTKRRRAEATLAGVRILVVDDEEDAREAMVVLLEPGRRARAVRGLRRRGAGLAARRGRRTCC